MASDPENTIQIELKDILELLEMIYAYMCHPPILKMYKGGDDPLYRDGFCTFWRCGGDTPPPSIPGIGAIPPDINFKINFFCRLM